MKHIRLLSLSLALVLLVGLFAACGKTSSGSESGSDAQSSASASQSGADVSAPGDASQPDVSAPDASQEEDAPQAPEAKPEEKPQSKPEAPAPQPKPEEKPETPAPGQGPDELPALPIPEAKPEEKPAGADLAAFYETIFTDPANAPALIPMEGETLDAFYPGLTALSLKQKVAYMPMMTAVPCEIVMVECANAADVSAVKAIFQARIDDQVNNHMNYPMVIDAWENESTVVSNGNFVALFVISGMTDEVVSSFNALF